MNRLRMDMICAIRSEKLMVVDIIENEECKSSKVSFLEVYRDEIESKMMFRNKDAKLPDIDMFIMANISLGMYERHSRSS